MLPSKLNICRSFVHFYLHFLPLCAELFFEQFSCIFSSMLCFCRHTTAVQISVSYEWLSWKLDRRCVLRFIVTYTTRPRKKYNKLIQVFSAQKVKSHWNVCSKTRFSHHKAPLSRNRTSRTWFILVFQLWDVYQSNQVVPAMTSISIQTSYWPWVCVAPSCTGAKDKVKSANSLHFVQTKPRNHTCTGDKLPCLVFNGVFALKETHS